MRIRSPEDHFGWQVAGFRDSPGCCTLSPNFEIFALRILSCANEAVLTYPKRQVLDWCMCEHLLLASTCKKRMCEAIAAISCLACYCYLWHVIERAF